MKQEKIFFLILTIIYETKSGSIFIRENYIKTELERVHEVIR